MVEVKCDCWTCLFFDDWKCKAPTVELEEQGDTKLLCLTYEKYSGSEQQFLERSHVIPEKHTLYRRVLNDAT